MKLFRTGFCESNTVNLLERSFTVLFSDIKTIRPSFHEGRLRPFVMPRGLSVILHATSGLMRTSESKWSVFVVPFHTFGPLALITFDRCSKDCHCWNPPTHPSIYLSIFLSIFLSIHTPTSLHSPIAVPSVHPFVSFPVLLHPFPQFAAVGGLVFSVPGLKRGQCTWRRVELPTLGPVCYSMMTISNIPKPKGCANCFCSTHGTKEVSIGWRWKSSCVLACFSEVCVNPLVSDFSEYCILFLRSTCTSSSTKPRYSSCSYYNLYSFLVQCIATPASTPTSRTRCCYAKLLGFVHDTTSLPASSLLLLGSGWPFTNEF